MERRKLFTVMLASAIAGAMGTVEQLQLGGIDFTVTGTGTYAITRHLLPFMAATVAVLLLVTYVPSLTLGVARFLQ